MKIATIAHGSSVLLIAARAVGLRDEAVRVKVQTCNLASEEIAEHDRPMSRQQRRAAERRARKTQTKEQS